MSFAYYQTHRPQHDTKRVLTMCYKKTFSRFIGKVFRVARRRFADLKQFSMFLEAIRL